MISLFNSKQVLLTIFSPLETIQDKIKIALILKNFSHEKIVNSYYVTRNQYISKSTQIYFSPNSPKFPNSSNLII